LPMPPIRTQKRTFPPDFGLYQTRIYYVSIVNERQMAEYYQKKAMQWKEDRLPVFASEWVVFCWALPFTPSSVRHAC
jgi:hypothetical protein